MIIFPSCTTGAYWLVYNDYYYETDIILSSDFIKHFWNIIQSYLVGMSVVERMYLGVMLPITLVLLIAIFSYYLIIEKHIAKQVLLHILHTFRRLIKQQTCSVASICMPTWKINKACVKSVCCSLTLVRYLTLESPCEFGLEFQGSGVVTALTWQMKNSEPISPQKCKFWI